MSFFVYGGSVKNTIQLFETKSKYNNAHPNFNEEFVLQTTGDWKKIDIQISIKVDYSNLNTPLHDLMKFQNYSIIGENRTIGLYLLKLSKFKSIPSIRERVLLYKSNVFNTFSKTILLILADRYSDQVARRFVKAKLENTV